MIFQHYIDGFASWSRIFQDIEVWQPLAAAIYRHEEMPFVALGPLTPGTNAVFRSGTTVIKIYAPPEAEISDACEFTAEYEALRQAEVLGVPTPRVIAAGEYQDRYLFKYLILSYISGHEMGDVLQKVTAAEQDELLKQIHAIVTALQRGNVEIQSLDFLIERALHNKRWSKYSAAVQQEVRSRLRGMAATKPRLIRVHGDMTGENLLLDDNGQVHLIDFADSCIAPPQYEYPALLFELFDLNAALIRRFFSLQDTAETARDFALDDEEMLFSAILLHDFGADYLRKAAERLLRCATEEVRDLAQLQQALTEHLRGG